MIPYETFPMHEKYQEEKFFLIKKEFNLPYLEDGRMKTTDFDEQFECIEFEEGDIIEIKPFKYSHDGILYTYLVNYYIDDEKFECGWETAMSLDFILVNKLVFEDVTLSMKRDKKIDSIIKNK
jgi:hypothetical protein